MLSPPRDGTALWTVNDRSLVLHVSAAGRSVLLPGDAGAEAEEAWLALTSTVVKVPHHGSQTTPTEFFRTVRPALAVISVGADNVYGHPHDSTLTALQGVRVLRTDLDGRVVVRSDGESLKIWSER